MKRTAMAMAMVVLGVVGCGGSGGGGGGGGGFDIATQMVANAYFYAPLTHPPTDFSMLALIYDPTAALVQATLPGGNLALRGFSGPLTGPTTFTVDQAQYGAPAAASGTGEVTNDGNAVDVSFTLTSSPSDPPWTFTGTLDHVGPLGG